MDLDDELTLVAMINDGKGYADISSRFKVSRHRAWQLVNAVRTNITAYPNLPKLPDGRRKGVKPDAPLHEKILATKRAWCKRNRVPFDLKRADVPPIPTTCPALPDVVFTKESTPILDLIHPHLGYVKGNVLWVSKKARDIRGYATPVELAKVAKFYHQAQHTREQHRVG